MSERGNTGNLGSGPHEETCAHACSQCGKTGQDLAFSLIRDADVKITRNYREERYRIRGISGGYPYSLHADLAESSEQVELPPPPPEVWLVYKHGGAYRYGDALQGIYSSEEGAKDSVRFSVKEERASLARRLGQPVTHHSAEEPELKWVPGYHWRSGPIPGQYHAEAGLANFVVQKYRVPDGYLPDVTWCVVPHVSGNLRGEDG